jgi:hypothetical protein
MARQKMARQKMARQGRKARHHRQLPMAIAIGIGMPSSASASQGIGKACHHRQGIGIGRSRHHHRHRQGIGIGMPLACHWHAIIGISMLLSASQGIIGRALAIAIIGMPSSARHAIGKARDARTQGIGMPSSACRQGIIGIGMPSALAETQEEAGRSTVAQYSHAEFSRVFRCAIVQIFECVYNLH